MSIKLYGSVKTADLLNSGLSGLKKLVSPIIPGAIMDRGLNAAGNFTKNTVSSLLPQTTQNYIKPAWQGVRTELAKPNWSVDSLLNAGSQGVEANRAAPMVNKLNNFGLAVNKNEYGVPDYNNPINWGNTFENIKNKGLELGNSVLGWAKDNPLTAGLGGAALLGGGAYLGSKLFGGSDNQVVQPNQSAPVYNTVYSPGTPQALQKAGEFNSPFHLNGAIPMVNQTASFFAPKPRTQDQPTEQQINVVTENSKLRELLQKPDAQAYLLSLLK